jgi:hypothetical protein
VGGSPTRAAWLVALVLLVAAIAGCGGGGSSSTSTATASSGAASEGQATESKPLPGHPKISAKPGKPRAGAEPKDSPYGSFTRASAAAAERKAERRKRATHRKLARKAGKAAPFLVSEGDNSVPTYGSEASASVRGEAERVLSGYLRARAAENWSAACAAMSSQVAKQLAVLSGQSTKPDCVKAYAALAEKGSAAERADPMVGGIVSLRVESPHAFALFFGPGKQQYMMPLEEEGGAWKVTQIAPVPWPVGSLVEGSSR